MGTQFSKIKVTQRVEVHGQVIHDYYAINQNGGYYQTGSDMMMESTYNNSNYSHPMIDRYVKHILYTETLNMRFKINP